MLTLKSPSPNFSGFTSCLTTMCLTISVWKGPSCEPIRGKTSKRGSYRKQDLRTHQELDYLGKGHQLLLLLQQCTSLMAISTPSWSSIFKLCCQAIWYLSWNWQARLASVLKATSSQDPALLTHRSMVDFGRLILFSDMSNGSATSYGATGVFTLDSLIM